MLWGPSLSSGDQVPVMEIQHRLWGPSASYREKWELRVISLNVIKDLATKK